MEADLGREGGAGGDCVNMIGNLNVVLKCSICATTLQKKTKKNTLYKKHNFFINSFPASVTKKKKKSCSHRQRFLVIFTKMSRPPDYFVV